MTINKRVVTPVLAIFFSWNNSNCHHRSDSWDNVFYCDCCCYMCLLPPYSTWEDREAVPIQGIPFRSEWRLRILTRIYLWSYWQYVWSHAARSFKFFAVSCSSAIFSWMFSLQHAISATKSRNKMWQTSAIWCVILHFIFPSVSILINHMCSFRLLCVIAMVSSIFYTCVAAFKL